MGRDLVRLRIKFWCSTAEECRGG